MSDRLAVAQARTRVAGFLRLHAEAAPGQTTIMVVSNGTIRLSLDVDDLLLIIEGSLEKEEINEQHG